VIVADTGVVLALLDRDDADHAEVLHLYRETGDGWILPWAILPEVDYLVARHCGRRTATAFRSDLAEGAWVVEWGDDSDLVAAETLLTRYADLNLGLVDAVVMAMAGRLGAEAIATLDLRHFGAVAMAGSPRLLPRDF
jgi:predicted nucleic acid-binding protein